MKYLRVSPILLLCICICTLQVGCDRGVSNPTSSDGLGQSAADFTFTDIDGEELTLSEHSGKVVILDFWATWCPPCRLEIPHYNELTEEYRDQGLVVIGLSVGETTSTVRGFRESTPMNYLIAVCDDATWSTYQSYIPPQSRGGIPTTYIIDREGIIVAYYVGYRDKAVFEAAIEPLL